MGSKYAIQETTELPLAWFCYLVSISLICTSKPSLAVHLTVGRETTWVLCLFAKFDLEAFG